MVGVKMKIYIDDDYKCHVSPADGLTAIETDYFDGLCAAAIEGHRYIPPGSTWTRADGVRFHGEAYSLAVDYAPLAAAQRAYEREQIAQYDSALSEIETALGVNA